MKFWFHVQIQTVKTQEMNLLREQQEALTAELQQRRAEQESLLAQRDDLDSQLQVPRSLQRRLKYLNCVSEFNVN